MDEKFDSVFSLKNTSFDSRDQFEHFMVAEGLEVLSVYRLIADRHVRFSLRHLMQQLAESKPATPTVRPAGRI